MTGSSMRSPRLGGQVGKSQYTHPDSPEPLKAPEEPTNGLALPRYLLKWIALGLILTASIPVIISILSGVDLTALAQLGYLQFGLAAAVSSARLLVQVLRFQVIVAGVAGSPKPDMRGSTTARIGSEFVALSTPASIGGEFVRAAWLSGKGVLGGRALWIGYFEVLVDVYVGSALALVAAAYAFSRGANAVGLAIGAVALILVVGYTLVFLIPAVRGVPTVPRGLFTFVGYFLGRARARQLETVVQQGSQNFSIAARTLLRKDSIPMLLKVVSLTMVMALLSGVTLWIVLASAGLNIDLFSSTVVAYGAMAIAAIPISIGGSGLTELTVQAYVSAVFGFSSWAAIVFWRIASFQVILAISGLAFLLLVHRGTVQTPKALAVEKTPSNGVPARLADDSGPQGYGR